VSYCILRRTLRTALDDRISELAMLIREHYGIDELGDPATSTNVRVYSRLLGLKLELICHDVQDEITVVGRITLDAESSSTGSVKLNEASLCLESPRSFRGLRVAVRMAPQVKIRGGAKGAGGLGFFQGEIVALRGKNGSGADGYFLVNEILAVSSVFRFSSCSPDMGGMAKMPPMKPSPSASSPSGFGKPFTMCICSGPYTSESDLKYTPWHVLLATLKTSKPNVVLLVRPFL
jgi:DNA polymerase alpha subunit B